MRHIFFLLTFLFSLTVFSQEYKVQSFEHLRNDLSARTNPRVDGNGRKGALLKVQVADDIVDVEGNVIGDIINKGMEKWIYVTDHTKQIRINFKNHYPLKISFIDYDFPVVTEQMVYEIKLTDAGVALSDSGVTKASTPAQGSSVSLPPNKHEKRTLYTFGDGERIYDNEYLSSRKFGNGNWMMITQSPSGWKLIKNGNVIVRDAKGIDLLAYDANVNKAVYCYKNNENEIYAHVDDADIGPFTSLWNFEGNLENPMKASFIYEKMGIKFYRNYNGKSYNLGDHAEVGDSRIKYSSLNDSHTLQFSSDKKAIIVDGKRIELLPSSNPEVYIGEVYVFDNGNWFVSGYTKDKDGAGSYFKKGCANGKIKDLSGTDSGVHPIKGIMDYNTATNTDAMKKYKQLWYRPFDRKWNEEEEKLEVKTQFLINGRSSEDEFISNWEYDYVMINNKKVGTAAAIDAWYDPALNAFIWITIDENSLVENAYKL